MYNCNAGSKKALFTVFKTKVDLTAIREDKPLALRAGETGGHPNQITHREKGGRAFLKEGIKNVQVVRDFPNRVCGFYPL